MPKVCVPFSFNGGSHPSSLDIITHTGWKANPAAASIDLELWESRLTAIPLDLLGRCCPVTVVLQSGIHRSSIAVSPKGILVPVFPRMAHTFPNF